MTQLLFLQIDEEYLKDHKSRGKYEQWTLRTHRWVPCHLVCRRLGNLTRWYVPSLRFPYQRSEVTHIEGNTLLRSSWLWMKCVFPPRWKYVIPVRRKYSVVVEEVSEWNICIPRLLWPLFNDQGGGLEPELRPIIRDLALYWHWLQCMALMLQYSKPQGHKQRQRHRQIQRQRQKDLALCSPCTVWTCADNK